MKRLRLFPEIKVKTLQTITIIISKWSRMLKKVHLMARLYLSTSQALLTNKTICFCETRKVVLKTNLKCWIMQWSILLVIDLISHSSQRCNLLKQLHHRMKTVRYPGPIILKATWRKALRESLLLRLPRLRKPIMISLIIKAIMTYLLERKSQKIMLNRLCCIGQYWVLKRMKQLLLMNLSKWSRDKSDH